MVIWHKLKSANRLLRELDLLWNKSSRTTYFVGHRRYKKCSVSMP